MIKKALTIFLCASALILLVLSGCKLQIGVPKGGHVITESGNHECQSGQVCLIDIYDVYFDETFIAVPDPGHKFIGWKKKRKGFCGGMVQPCHLLTAGFLGNDLLMAILESDKLFYLKPLFVACDVNDRDCNGVELIGEPEVVFNWSVDQCEDLDIPDLSPRAFRDHHDQVHLIAGELKSIGPDLDTQSHQCGGVIPSDRDANPANFNDDEMVGATYTEDGETIYAIVHNEHHAFDHPGQCTASDTFRCWYNGLTLAVSTDGGFSFRHPVTPPNHLVASYPRKYIIDTGPYGAFSPSSIVKGLDNFYYAIIEVSSHDIEYDWSCLMRSDDLSAPDSWRFWDGKGFNGQFVNPYTGSFENADEHVCAPIAFEQISDMHDSLTYNEYLESYMLLGASSEGNTEGFYYSLSKDLINWTPRQLIFEGPQPGSEVNPSETGYLYPALLDPNSTSRSFDTAGKIAYIYYAKFNDTTGGTADRDLMRIPVEFFRY